MQRLFALLPLTAAIVVIAVGASQTKAQQTLARAYADMPTHWGSSGPRDNSYRSYGTVPGPPSRPYSATRPDSWPSNPVPAKQGDGLFPPPPISGPNGYPAQTPTYPQTRVPDRTPTYPHTQSPRSQQQPNPPAGQPPVVEPVEPCDTAQIVGWVGSEVILASELVVGIDGLLAAAFQDKLSPEEFEAQSKKYRREAIRGIRELVTGEFDRDDLTQGQQERKMLVTQLLKRQIEVKLMYHDARRGIPEEGFPEIEKNFGRLFEKQVLPKMIEEAEVKTRREFDEKLRAQGSSLQRVKRSFVQRALAESWRREQLDLNREITYDEIVAYYYDHLSDYEHPGRARWEELMVRSSKFPNEAAAHAELARMGNQVWKNVPLAQVAKASSHGPTAVEGGIRDWTTQGSLVSNVLDRALFGLPVGRLSPILRTEDGLYIIRVIERKEAGRTPFLEAQVEIRPKIQQERFRREYKGYIDRLYRDIPVRTASNLPVRPAAKSRR